jgi:hypothetical protein
MNTSVSVSTYVSCTSTSTSMSIHVYKEGFLLRIVCSFSLTRRLLVQRSSVPPVLGVRSFSVCPSVSGVRPSTPPPAFAHLASAHLFPGRTHSSSLGFPVAVARCPPLQVALSGLL